MQGMTADTRTLDAATLSHLQSWQGRTETLTDDITAAPVRALSATLDRDDPAPVPGTALPPLWHWLYFLPHQRQSEIGPDGHAKRGGFLPPVPLPRRMWAGGRLQWERGNPLVVGDAVQRTSRIESVTHKAGRTGDLLFVRVKHEVHNAQGLALTEAHDIVYRAAVNPPPLPPGGPGAARRRSPPPTPRHPPPPPKKALPGNARLFPTTCCCSATRRSRSTATASTTTGAT